MKLRTFSPKKESQELHLSCPCGSYLWQHIIQSVSLSPSSSKPSLSFILNLHHIPITSPPIQTSEYHSQINPSLPHITSSNTLISHSTQTLQTTPFPCSHSSYSSLLISNTPFFFVLHIPICHVHHVPHHITLVCLFLPSPSITSLLNTLLSLHNHHILPVSLLSFHVFQNKQLPLISFMSSIISTSCVECCG